MYELDWDLLIVLDACRVDALRAVADEYEFVGEVNSIWSVGSTSKEWLENTFIQKHNSKIAEAGLVTANTFSRVFRPEREGDDRFDYILGQESKITDFEFLKSVVNYKTVTHEDFYYFDDIGNKMINSGELEELHPEIVTDRAINTARQKIQID